MLRATSGQPHCTIRGASLSSDQNPSGDHRQHPHGSIHAFGSARRGRTLINPNPILSVLGLGMALTLIIMFSLPSIMTTTTNRTRIDVGMPAADTAVIQSKHSHFGKPLDDATIPEEKKSNSNSAPTRSSIATTTNKATKVFIGIKTSEDGVHGIRLPQIQKTWFKDALQASPNITIKFFTDLKSTTSRLLSNENKATKTTKEGQYDISNATATHDETIVGNIMESMTVFVKDCQKKLNIISCKTAAMMEYFLQHDATSTFFCNFDDDNYVIVSNLWHALNDAIQEQPSNHDDGNYNIYMGRLFSTFRGFSLKPFAMTPGEFDTTPLINHLTGGAGYCLSRDLVERGREWFLSPPERVPDDVAVGYIVQEKLKTKARQNDLFHSHYESNLQSTMKLNDVSKQVSFGFNNKHTYEFARKSMPNIPVLFTPRDDPLMFRSLRCFLLSQPQSNHNHYLNGNFDIKSIMKEEGCIK